MSRNLLKVSFNYENTAKICVMNTHLESLRDCKKAKIRKEQLKLCFDHVQQENEERMVIFGGDLNLRDKEVNKAQQSSSAATYFYFYYKNLYQFNINYRMANFFFVKMKF
jgi:endonuclease/exonuclease/phosphatase family metal-dependent hydrolase